MHGKSWRLGAITTKGFVHGTIGNKAAISLQTASDATSRRRENRPKTLPSGRPTMESRATGTDFSSDSGHSGGKVSRNQTFERGGSSQV